MEAFGIDIGGSGIKGAPVDIWTGQLLAERYRLPTPQPSKPEMVAKAVAKIARHFNWLGPIGCGFPASVLHGVTMTAANVDQSWIGTDAASLFRQATGCPTRVINDADAAGLAEMEFGQGKGRKGVVLIVTIGTGLGTSLFTDGYLVPNLELGHLEVRGMEAELRASDATRKREGLSWKKWAKQLNLVLNTLDRLLWPDLIILGGGVSKYSDRFLPYLTVRSEVIPAMLGNEAGIIGAALISPR